MTSSDADSRALMLNAIAAVLKFTESEIECVKKYDSTWWWQATAKTKTNPK